MTATKTLSIRRNFITEISSASAAIDPTDTDINAAIGVLERSIDNAAVGLREELFRFVSRLTVMVNIDLLVKDELNRVLLSWRDTEFSGAGWHVPGGIIRYKESLEDRIRKVAQSEIGTVVDFDSNPVAINQIIKNHTTRGHFISILYICSLPSDFTPDNGSLSETEPGFLKWHEKCPDNLIEVHDVLYREHIEATRVRYFGSGIPCRFIHH